MCDDGFSAYHQIVAVENVGVGGALDLSLSVGGRETRGRKTANKRCEHLCEALTPWEMFCAVGDFLRMSNTCAEAVG